MRTSPGNCQEWQIVREVRTAWLQANTAYQRLGVTAQLLAEAKLSFQLAQRAIVLTSARSSNSVRRSFSKPARR
jgi:hypothetical protein